MNEKAHGLHVCILLLAFQQTDSLRIDVFFLIKVGGWLGATASADAVEEEERWLRDAELGGKHSIEVCEGDPEGKSAERGFSRNGPEENSSDKESHDVSAEFVVPIQLPQRAVALLRRGAGKVHEVDTADVRNLRAVKCNKRKGGKVTKEVVRRMRRRGRRIKEEEKTTAAKKKKSGGGGEARGAGGRGAGTGTGSTRSRESIRIRKQ